jgi:hypothetical protein
MHTHSVNLRSKISKKVRQKKPATDKCVVVDKIMKVEKITERE